MARVLVRLKREHEVLQEGQRVTLPAGSLVEVSEHTLRVFADRMELVEQASSPAAADDNTDGQQKTATGPQLVQDNDGETEDQQDQETTTGEQGGDTEGQEATGTEGASSEGNADSSEGSEASSEGSGEAEAEAEAEAPAQPEAEFQPPAYEIVQKPGGWYGIMVNGEEVAKARKDEIKTKLVELGLSE